ncbi:MAG: hypothetical protein VB031_02305 [Eubacteriaceae bacterium]|nr:hypothetical protein [Eubacteriaceae bacterium]
MKIYMAVTADKYELPTMVADSSKELAGMLGRTVNSVRSHISHTKEGIVNGKRCGEKLIVVDVSN